MTRFENTLRARDVRGGWCDLNERERDALAEERAAFRRAIFVAKHLFGMIPQDAWRAQGADDGQGHYEGDGWAEDTAAEIRGWEAMLARLDGTAAVRDPV